jgi:hypothetical protein
MNPPEEMRRGPQFWLIVPLILSILAMLVLRLSLGRPAGEVPRARASDARPPAISGTKEKEADSPAEASSKQEGPHVDAQATSPESVKLIVNVRDDTGRPLPGLKVIRSMTKGVAPIEGNPRTSRDPRWGSYSFFYKPGLYDRTTPLYTDHDGRAAIVVNTRLLRGSQAYMTVTVSGEGIVDDAFAKYFWNIPPPGTVHEGRILPRRGRPLRGQLVNMSPDDVEDMSLSLEEVSDDAGKGWTAVLKVDKEGSFSTPVVPMVPLVLEISHDRDKYLPIRQEIDPRQTNEIVVVLQPNPEYRRGQYLIVEFTPPGPGIDSLVAKIAIFRKESWECVFEIGGDLDFSRPRRYSLRPENYRLLVVSIWGAGLYGEADASLQPETDTRIAVQLRKSPQVIVAPRDQRTGRAFPYDRTDISVEWSPDGVIYPWMTAAFARRETYERTGEMVADVPPGRLRIVVQDTKGQYEPVTMMTNLAAGEVERLTAVLVPR